MWLVRQTRSDFPTTSGAFNEASNGGMDVFVSKLSISLPVSQYTLTVNKAGTGSGTVTSDPAGIDCGSVCSDTFKACTHVTLTATADLDSTFTGWTGCTTVSGNSCTVTMNKDKTVTATSTLKPLTPVTGDWNGDGKTKIGVYSNGIWSVDFNGNDKWDGTGPGKDFTTPPPGFGFPGATPVTGDWNGDGKTKIGVYYNGIWYIDFNRNGKWDGTGPGKDFTTPPPGFGFPGATPVTGDWNGDGKTKIGVYYNGIWYIDFNRNGKWDGTGPGKDATASFGFQGAIPVTGDWKDT